MPFVAPAPAVQLPDLHLPRRELLFRLGLSIAMSDGPVDRVDLVLHRSDPTGRDARLQAR
jgi:hypothetical protein